MGLRKNHRFRNTVALGKRLDNRDTERLTVYMSFYTINKHIKQNNIKPEALTPEVFDYIFYGKGNAQELQKVVGINAALLDSHAKRISILVPL